MAITRTTWTDDDGSGTTGTVINNAVKTELYNQIDAALTADIAAAGALKLPLTGGTLTGSLTVSNLADGANGLILKGAGTNGPALDFSNVTTGALAQMWVPNDKSFHLYLNGIERFGLTAAGALKLSNYGAGTATFDASGNVTSVSDERVKDRIAPLPYGLREVRALHPIQHGYTEDSGLDVAHLYGGFSAQDVQAVMPIAVGHTAAGYLTLADRPILGAVVHALQELAARLERLEAHG